MTKKGFIDKTLPVRDKEFYRQVARLHIAGINQGFLPQLGLDFMTLLYGAIDRSSSSVLLTESVNGEVVGFVSGASSMRPIYIKLLSKPLHLVVALAPSLVSPRRLKHIYEIIRYAGKIHSSQSVELPAFELLSIVVTPVVRGKGYADHLYRRLVEYCDENKIMSFKIVVGDALMPAHSFYKRMGAVPIGRVEVHAGESSIVYVHKIDSKKEPQA